MGPKRLKTGGIKISAMATVLALWITGSPSFALAAEPELPNVLNAWISDPDIDVIDASQEVTIRLEVEHRSSGLSKIELDPRPKSNTFHDAVESKVLDLVSGNNHRGIYETTYVFPQGAENGTWWFDGLMFDNEGNTYGTAGFSIDLEPIVFSHPDRQTPEIAGKLSSNLVDVTDGSGSVTLDLEVSDAGVGFPTSRQLRVKYSTGNFSTGRDIQATVAEKHKRKYRTVLDFSGNFAIGTVATSSISVEPIQDANGNATHWGSAVTLGTKPLRGRKPELLNTANGLVATWSPTPDPLGIREYEVQFVGPTETYSKKTTSLEERIPSASPGIYSARIRSRNVLGWSEWSSESTKVEYHGAVRSHQPSIIGTPTVGQTLTVAPGAWGPDGIQLSYQWAADGTNLDGATKKTLPLTADLAGKTITVIVTGSLDGYTTTSKTSTPTNAIGSLLIQAEEPTFDRVSGSYTVPSVPGVTYLVDGVEKKTGTYSSGYKKVTIVGRAAAGYTLAGTSTWTLDLSKIQVSAQKPTANFSTRTLTIPEVPGVVYSVDGAVRKSGNYRFSKQIIVVAQASAANYSVKAASWKYDLRTSITASKPAFDAKKNTVKIPAKTGATYYINGTKKKAGTYKYTGRVAVIAKLSTGAYKLKGTTSWSAKL